MELLKMGKVVRSVQPVRGELRDSQCARLCLPVRELVGVSQLGPVSRHGGTGVNVWVSH